MVVIVLSSSWSLAAPPLAVADVSQAGQYANTIADVVLVQDYVEICFASGAVLTDLHVGGGASVGGNCSPGVTGFIMDLAQRPGATWATARGTCLADGMRLPQPFELLYVCENATTLGYASTKVTSGWANNELFYFDFQITALTITDGFKSQFETCGDYYAAHTEQARFLCAM